MPFGNEKIETWQDFVDQVYDSYGGAFKLNNALLNAFRRHKIIGRYEFEDIEDDSEGQQLRRGLKFFKLITNDPDALDIPTFVEVVKKEVPTSAIALAFQAYYDMRNEQGFTGHTLISKALEAAEKGWKTYEESRPSGEQVEVPSSCTASSKSEVAVQEAPVSMAPTTVATSIAAGTVNITTNININNNTTTTTNVVNVTNNLNYFKNHAETYNFMNFALPKQGTEECGWSSPANLSDGIFSFKSPKKHKSDGNGLALLLNWSFDTNPADLPPEILENRANLERYLSCRRKGSEEDTKYVCSKFAELTGRSVVQELNIRTTQHLRERLEAFRSYALKLSPPPAYITVVVSTHGLNGYQLLLDHMGLADLFKDIVYPLSDEAPGFKGSAHFGADMPRLYFVQACQQDVPVEVGAGIKNEFPNVLSSASNFMVGLATIPSHVAWRNEGTGSYYIKYIHECFRKGRSLHEMLKEVDQKIRAKFDQKTSAYVSLDFPITDFKF